MVAPFIIGGLASIASSIIGSNSAKKAAKAQARAAAEANAFDRQMYEDNQARMRPYEETGRNALSLYSGALGVGGDPNGAASGFAAYRNTPGYQAQMAEGTAALDASAAARGGLFSGARGKAGIRFGQGLADQGFDKYLSNVGNLAGLGERTASNMAGAGTAFASRYGDRLTGAGNARAQGYINQSNAISGGIENVAGLANYYRPWERRA